MSRQVRSTADRAGVALVAMKIAHNLGWLFREQPISDVGIDGLVEVVEKGEATGQLIGVQIKSGESYFRSRSRQGFVYTTDDVDALHYWRSFAAPVILVLARPRHHKCWWQPVSNETVQLTPHGWSIVVPFDQRLEKSTIPVIWTHIRKWKSDQLYDALREFLRKPRESVLADKEQELISPWIREMDEVAISCLRWMTEVLQYYSRARLDWLQSNVLLNGLVWSTSLLVRWNPIDLNLRLVKFAILPMAIRQCAFHVLGTAGLDADAERNGLTPLYGYLIRPSVRGRQNLATLYEELKLLDEELKKHVGSIPLTLDQQVLAKQAEESIVHASSCGLFQFVDDPGMAQLAWVSHDVLREDLLAGPARAELEAIEARWRVLLQAPDHLVPFGQLSSLFEKAGESEGDAKGKGVQHPA